MLTFHSRSLPVLLVCCAALLLSACGSSAMRLKGETPQALFEEAKSLQDSGAYEASIKGFEQLEATFPYGSHAQQAQLEIAYSHYKMQEGALAIAACDRFLRQYPSHQNIDYALYLKALSTQISQDAIFTIMLQRDLSGLDQAAAHEAFDIFKDLVTRFPNSRYAADSQERMAKITDALARGDLNLARFYYRRGATLAAVNRAKDLLTRHPESNILEEALAMMAAGYRQLGLTALADDAQRVLRQNYPQSTWLKETYVAIRP